MIEIPPHRREDAREIVGRLERARSLAITTHVRGDGDGWGSATAIAHHYRPQGLDVRLAAPTPYPDRFRFLLPVGVRPMAPDASGREAFASAGVQILVDVSEPDRLGEFAADLDPARAVVIDHHPRPSGRLARCVSLIDPEAAATVELVHDILQTSGRPLARETALALYVGLVTDTGSFRYSNVRARTHRLAAELIEVGVDPGEVYNELFGTLTAAELGTLRAALDALGTDHESGLSWIALGAEVRERQGDLDDYEWILAHARNVEGTEVAVLFRELGDGSIKVSLRSNGPARVAEVARELGGGGHEKAAGAVVEGGLEEVMERVLESCRRLIESTPGIGQA